MRKKILLIKDFFVNVKRRIWNKRILIWYYSIMPIPKYEFHKSLYFDANAFSVMSKKEREKYGIWLMLRRNEAHENDLKRQA